MRIHGALREFAAVVRHPFIDRTAIAPSDMRSHARRATGRTGAIIGVFPFFHALDATGDAMPNISRSSPSVSNASSRSSSPDPSDSDSDSGSDTDVRSRTSAAEPPPLPERPEFLKRMQSSAGASSRPTTRQLTTRIADTNVRLTAATRATTQTAIELARRTGGPMQHRVASLDAAEGRHERALDLANRLTEQEAERQGTVHAARAAHEQTLLAAGERLEAFAAGFGTRERANRPGSVARDHSTPPGNRAAIHHNTPVLPGHAVQGPARQFHVQDVVLHYIEQDTDSLVTKGGNELLDFVFDLGERLGLDERVLGPLRHELFPWNALARRTAARVELEHKLDEAITQKIDSRFHVVVRSAIARHMKEMFYTPSTETALTEQRPDPTRKPRL
ncbi:hypothetical protein [Burkholderia sp. YIM B11467]